MIDLIRLSYELATNVYHFSIHPYLVLGAAAIIILIIFLKFRSDFLPQTFEIDSIQLGVSEAPKFTIKPNMEDVQIAYRLWVELKTRKIGLEIDYDNDVIVELYNSWYEFFRITRELIKNIPASKIRKSEDTRKLVNLAVDVLNTGMRPHLTMWQARFRRWYAQESEKEANKNIAPQEIQKRFPEYNSLVENMKKVNGNLINYRKKLREISMGKEEKV